MRLAGIVLPALGASTFVTGAWLLNGGPSAIVLAGITMLVGALAISVGLAYWD